MTFVSKRVCRTTKYQQCSDR